MCIGHYNGLDFPSDQGCIALLILPCRRIQLQPTSLIPKPILHQNSILGLQIDYTILATSSLNTQALNQEGSNMNGPISINTS